MKKFFAAVVCCALLVTNALAQEGISVVETPSSDVVLTSAQEPAPEAQKSATDVAAPVDNTVIEAPATHVSQDPAIVDATAAPVVEGTPIEAPMYGQAVPMSTMSNGCGCGSGVVTNYAAPMSSYAAPVASGCCAAPVAACCPPSRGFNRPQVIRGFGSRWTSVRGRGNNCCN